MVIAILNRILASITVMLGAITLVFFVLHWLPGDTAAMMAQGTIATPEAIEYVRNQLGLDRPVYVQFFSYIWDTLRGDLGRSYLNNQPVWEKLSAQFPATLALASSGAVVTTVLGVILGVVSAIFNRRWIDNVIRVISLFGISMPPFWTGILLILFFSVRLNWLPAIGSGTWVQLILPVGALGISGAGSIARIVRSSILDAISDPSVLTLRAKGLQEAAVLYKHVLRNAIIPALTVMGLIVGEMLAGAAVLETVFARQGVGRIIVDAIVAKDIPVIEGAVLFAAVVNILVNLIVDIAYTIIDPRIRRSS